MPGRTDTNSHAESNTNSFCDSYTYANTAANAYMYTGCTKTTNTNAVIANTIACAGSTDRPGSVLGRILQREFQWRGRAGAASRLEQLIRSGSGLRGRVELANG